MGFPGPAAPHSIVDWGAVPAWHITLPYDKPPLTGNATARGRGVVHAVTRAEVRASVGFALKAAKIPRLKQVVVVLTYYPGHERGPDSDNLGPTLKPCIDAMRDAGVIPEDDARVVRFSGQRVVHRSEDPYRSKTPRLVLSIYQADGMRFLHPAPGPAAALTTAHEVL
jgi:hypothetical protein